MSRRLWYLELVLVLTAVVLGFQDKLWRSGRVFTGRENPQIDEAQAWWQGRLTLPERHFDTALVGDQVYSHFPPLFSALAAIFVPFFGGVPRWALVLTLVVPLALLAYWLFSQRIRQPFGGAVFAIALIFGTSLCPVIHRVLATGGPWFVNQALGTAGLLLFLIDYTGRRRIWPGAIGLILGAFSRQLTIFYFPALLLAAYRSNESGPTLRWRKVAMVIAAAGFVVIVQAAFNQAKFGHPLDSGYLKIYEGRDDKLARDARQFGFFSSHYIPRNLYYTTVAPPVERRPDGRMGPNVEGTSILLTTPLLFWLLFDIRRLWRDRDARWLLAGAATIYTVLLFYHSTGYAQRGYNRYSLDYVPVLLVLIAPTCWEGRRKWVSMALIAWSVAYFVWFT